MYAFERILTEILPFIEEGREEERSLLLIVANSNVRSGTLVKYFMMFATFTSRIHEDEIFVHLQMDTNKPQRIS